MLVRKYRARNLKEALSQVKEDLGENATILSTRTVSAGLFRSQLEVTAAIAPMPVPAPPPPPPPPTPPPAALTLEVQQVARFLSPLRQELQSLHNEIRALAGGHDPSQKIETALDDLRMMLRALQQRPEPASAPASAQSPQEELLSALEERLQQTGMRPSLAATVLEQVAGRMPSHPAEAAACTEGLAVTAIGSALRCVPALETSPSPRCAALVGPAGVGKTTTLAKIATRAALLHHRRVAVVGCDTERIGAVRSLQDTARLIGIPFRAARNADELRRAVDELSDNDLTLVDTTGHSARDLRAMESLRDLLAAAGVEPCLLLNADLRCLEIDANLTGFSMVEPQSLIFTKLDQAVALGGLYDAVTESSLPVMYLTNGRRIPEDITEAKPAELASLILAHRYN